VYRLSEETEDSGQALFIGKKGRIGLSMKNRIFGRSGIDGGLE
jgi:hypothetical protein